MDTLECQLKICLRQFLDYSSVVFFKVICLSPTYELALQTGQVAEKMGKFCPEVKIGYAVRGEKGKKLSSASKYAIKVKPSSQGWLIAAGAYPGFCSMKRLEVFLLPLDGMLVHRRLLPGNFVRFPQQIAGTHLYTWVERETVRVKCLAQEHNTLSPARARTQTARYGVKRTNHEATTPPIYA